MSLNRGELSEFARRYTEAWCSGDPSRVADHYSSKGRSRSMMDTVPWPECDHRSRAGFMVGFPDLRVETDELRVDGVHPEYHWTLTGTKTGRPGTGRSVRISGYEQWTISDDGLIAASLGRYDQADWDRQVTGDAEG